MVGLNFVADYGEWTVDNEIVAVEAAVPVGPLDESEAMESGVEDVAVEETLDTDWVAS